MDVSIERVVDARSNVMWIIYFQQRWTTVLTDSELDVLLDSIVEQRDATKRKDG